MNLAAVDMTSEAAAKNVLRFRCGRALDSAHWQGMALDDQHRPKTLLAREPKSPCATMSTLTYNRTSRSLHFPFWAVWSLSGTQPEISFGRLHRGPWPMCTVQLYVENDRPSLFVASSIPPPLASARRRVRGPRPRPGRAHLGCA